MPPPVLLASSWTVSACGGVTGADPIGHPCGISFMSGSFREKTLKSQNPQPSECLHFVRICCSNSQRDVPVNKRYGMSVCPFKRRYNDFPEDVIVCSTVRYCSTTVGSGAMDLQYLL